MNILRGPPDSNLLPRLPLGNIFYDALKSLPDDSGNGMLNYSQNCFITYREFFQATIALARNIKKMGIKKHDIVTIASNNTWECLAILISCFYIGATVQLLNYNYTPDEFEHIFKNFKPKLIFCVKQALPSFLDAIQPDCVVLIDEKTEHFLHFSELIANSETTQDLVLIEPINRKTHPAIMLTSSGTTGLPKTVLISHSNFRVTIQHLLNPDIVGSETNAEIQYLPIFHCFGVLTALTWVLARRKLIFLEKYNSNSFLHIIQTYKIQNLFAVPTTLSFLVKNTRVDQYDLSTLHNIIVGASETTKQLQEMVEAKFGRGSLRQGYGTTEVSGFIAMSTSNSKSPKYGSVGRVTMTHSVVICAENGDHLGPNQAGELRVSGDGVMLGYFMNSAATADCFDANGFMKTGDLAYYDNDGDLYIIGRLKELIKYKGFQVAPAELEMILLRHEAVQEAGVIGVPDEKSGQVAAAFIVQKQDCSLAEDEIVKFLNDRVSAEKRLYGGVRFVAQLPKTATGKIMRHHLFKLYNST